MDIQLPFIFTTLVLFVSTLIFFLIKPWRKPEFQKQSHQNLPASPPKLPIISHLHLLLGGLPHQALARVSRKYGRLLHLQLGQMSAVVISTREGAKQVLKDQDPACAGRPESLGFKIMWYNYTDLAFSPYNEHWRQMRKICVQELLSAQNVRAFAHIRQEEVSHFIESIRTGEPINLTEKLIKMSSSMILRAVLGKDPMRDGDALIGMMRKGMSMASGFELADLFPSSKLLNWLCWNKYRLLWMRRKLDPILDDIVEKHRLKQRGEFGGEDVVDALLRISDNEEAGFSIPRDSIKGTILDMFAGGTYSTSAIVEWAMAELMRNPSVMAKAQAEIREVLKGKKTIEDSDVQGLNYLKLLIKETLRLHPPAPMLPRACRDECTVDGYSIPLKSTVVINVWAFGRDPEYWHKPETFQPERFENSSMDYVGNNFEYLPFGSGRRMCPGMNFGLANAELPLARLLYHFNWKMPNGMVPEDMDMTERGGLIVLKKNALFLVPTMWDASES